LRENAEFKVYVLTPEESWECMAEVTYPGLLKHYVNPTKTPKKKAPKVGKQNAYYTPAEVSRNAGVPLPTLLDAEWYELKMIPNQGWAYVPVDAKTDAVPLRQTASDITVTDKNGTPLAVGDAVQSWTGHYGKVDALYPNNQIHVRFLDGTHSAEDRYGKKVFEPLDAASFEKKQPSSMEELTAKLLQGVPTAGMLELAAKRKGTHIFDEAVKFKNKGFSLKAFQDYVWDEYFVGDSRRQDYERGAEYVWNNVGRFLEAQKTAAPRRFIPAEKPSVMRPSGQICKDCREEYEEGECEQCGDHISTHCDANNSAVPCQDCGQWVGNCCCMTQDPHGNLCNKCFAQRKTGARQEYTSEGTSVNQLPGVFKRVEWEPKTINLDYGGGKFDRATEFLKGKDVLNLVFDPFNRAAEHNREIINTLKGRKADTATIANVLNVIKEPEIRKQVLNKVKSLVKPGGSVYISVYRGKGGAPGIPTTRGWQENRPIKTYLDEVTSVFSSAEIQGSLIVARV